MTRYKAQLTIVLEFDAQDEDHAEYVLQEMDYEFRYQGKIDSEILDQELKELED